MWDLGIIGVEIWDSGSRIESLRPFVRLKRNKDYRAMSCIALFQHLNPKPPK